MSNSRSASRIRSAVRRPGTYLGIACKSAFMPLTRVFRRMAFHLQGQMDINPRGRWYSPEFVDQTGGFFLVGDPVPRTICDLEPWDSTRRDMLVLLLRTVLEHDIEGDLAEVGVYRGSTARLFHHYLPERPLHLFDTFEGFTDRGQAAEHDSTGKAVPAGHFSDTSLQGVLNRVNPVNDNVHTYRGYFPDTIPAEFSERRFAFIHLDADLYEPILAGLRFFYPKLESGGMIVVHDYNAWIGARRAVDAFSAEMGIIPIPLPDKSGSALIVRSGSFDK